MSTSKNKSQDPTPVDRAAVNRANSQHSTGPRTESGKQRSSQNALRHGLTAASAVLPSEDQAAFDALRRSFFDQHKPATPIETQLVQELVDTAWRLNRIPLLEAELFSQNPNPQTVIPALATLGLHCTRLSRQFQKAVDKLREIQADRVEHERGELVDAADILDLHNQKGLPWEPSDHGFVFSNDHVESFAERIFCLEEARDQSEMPYGQDRRKAPATLH